MATAEEIAVGIEDMPGEIAVGIEGTPGEIAVGIEGTPGEIVVDTTGEDTVGGMNTPDVAAMAVTAVGD